MPPEPQVAADIRPDQRWCKWCKTAQAYQRFDRHIKACERQHRPPSPPVSVSWRDKTQRNFKTSKVAIKSIPDTEIEDPDLDTDGMFQNELEPEVSEMPLLNETSDRDIDLESEDEPQLDHQQSSSRITNGPPSSFIEVIHHPHSGKHTPTIIPLDELGENGSARLRTIPKPQMKPWAPFRTRSDFEFTEQVVTKCFSKDTVDVLLDGLHGRWAKSTTITLRNHRDVNISLEAARKFGVPFQDGVVEHTFRSHTYTFKFKFRDTWEWILDLVSDVTLSEQIMWYPVQKFLNNGFRIIRIYDELNSGEAWWEIQSSLPQEDGVPHCFLPLHLWLDKSKVSEKIKMHPILVRPGFLPSAIRNGSGNGGGVLIGYMPIVGNPNESVEAEDDSAASVEIACFKREVYHKVVKLIFASLKNPSRYGEAVNCGDKILRVLFPGFLIHSVDGEEGCCTCGTRGAKANHPCPRCLISKTLLYQLSKKATPRSQHTMQEVFRKAKDAASASSRENILKEYGLHLVKWTDHAPLLKNAFWQFGNSDPYAAYSYDMLHSFDSGEWGKHQWPLLLKILTASEQARLSKNIDKTPRWRGLKHFKAVASTDFTDGNSYKDILKIILPSLVDLLPANSSFVHCVRLLGIMRAIGGLSVIQEDQIKYLELCLSQYEKHCIIVSQKYGKNYNYPKHHGLLHLPEDLRAKGTTENYSTRPGEGFQQEVQQAYDQTNFRNVEPQMTKIDENQEVIAQIRMSINHFDVKMSLVEEELDRNDGGPLLPPIETEAHWALGSRLTKLDPEGIEQKNSQNPGYHQFTIKLTKFLEEMLDLENQLTSPFQLTPYQCLYLKYRSLEDWREKQDILRCNPDFYGEPRYDCVVINTNPISFGRIQGIFACKGENQRLCTVVLVSKFEVSKWKPKTRWDGCQVFEEKGCQFVFSKIPGEGLPYDTSS
ncbi:hypothetical protein M422DRAFT_249859 [Sphaerobolus stellatus SS14]|uniref:Uncharacterized protein n=1 Tax=Sphaerobolus stellatus (strain SS14) TaxID=990650 RepID=A0A0C9UUG4_SPHS4|nr:hypothetical protein M422DRAFT_249859 [Sphaerobolus stellatus SS14]